ncbi:microtubule-associated protein TORTIFOLIA1-like [Phragmites australis]|uniref:microtubule-associated protein TORTIFOLIA1-like n=1 Tax=Phragmites australis TaxID=29695 RepID=UPI002D76ECD9|nr:microtubule-associated protein TORTIFOLIA1-like [Phragmites australis]
MATALSKSTPKSHPRSPTTAQPPPSNSGPAAASAGGGMVPTSGVTSATPSKNMAMVELKSRVLATLAKLSDRKTHHIAVEDLDRIIRSLPSPGAVLMLLNSLASDSRGLASPARCESLRLLATWTTPPHCRTSWRNYIQGPGVYDPCDRGHLQAAAFGLCQSEQSFRGGYAV